MEPSDYALLELIDRLGGVQGRKRLQKLVYLAKQRDLPIDDDFSFHYYGPYSSTLAARVDQLTQAEYLKEEKHEQGDPKIVEYAYAIAEKGEEWVQTVRKSAPDDFRARLKSGLVHADSLNKQPQVFVLELASTILYWRNQGYSWSDAEETTLRRKHAVRDTTVFQDACQIARDAAGDSSS